jgi:tRNA-specific 2-thiouridylase
MCICRYVTAKDMTHNVAYVSRSYYEQHKRRDAFVCGPFNWLSELRPNPSQPLMVKVRHGPNMYSCTLQLGLQKDVLAHAEPAGTAEVDSATPVAAAAAAAGAAHTAQGNSSSSSSSSIGSNCLGSGSQLQEQQQQQLLPSFTGEGQYGLVVLSENDQGLAAGQYAVFYQSGACLGSAQMLGSVAR